MIWIRNKGVTVHVCHVTSLKDPGDRAILQLPAQGWKEGHSNRMQQKAWGNVINETNPKGHLVTQQKCLS